MKIAKTLNWGIITAVIVSALAFFLPIIPCKTAPVVANPDYKLALCKIPNPFGEQLVGVSKMFYGLSADPLAALIFTFIAVFIIVLLLFTVIKKKKGKIVDLTAKKR